MPFSLNGYLIVSAVLLFFGIFTVLTRRNIIGVLMGIELIMNAAGLNFAAFSRFGSSVPETANLSGQVFTLFIIVISAAEITVALAIVLSLYHHTRRIDIEAYDLLGDKPGPADQSGGGRIQTEGES